MSMTVKKGDNVVVITGKIKEKLAKFWKFSLKITKFWLMELTS